MPDHEEVIKWLVALSALIFGAFFLLFALRTWRQCGQPFRWPVAGRWLVTGLVFGLAARFVDLTVARFTGGDLNAPRTIAWWLVMDLCGVWVAERWFTGRMLLGERPPPPRGANGERGA